MHCIVCLTIYSNQEELKNIDVITPFSKKSVAAVIKYLGKVASPSIDITWTELSSERQICDTCLKDILSFDKYMVRLRDLQARITSLLRNAAFKEDYITLQPQDNIVQIESINVCSGVEVYQNECVKKNIPLLDDKVKETTSRDTDAFKDLTDAEYDNSDLEDTSMETSSNLRKYNVPVKCTSCNKVLRNKSQLREHLKNVHRPFRKVWKCDICGKTAKDEEYLELHMNIHEGKSDLECRYCNKRYKRKINVIEHMQKHWDKKKYQCERCGLRFSERPAYYNHRLQHEAEEEPLICPVCNQPFKTIRTYKNHLWIHREDRPRFDCEICGKTFVEKYRLNLHQKCHHDDNVKSTKSRRKSLNIESKDKAFDCIICGEKFQFNDLYDQHVKTQHDVII